MKLRPKEEIIAESENDSKIDRYILEVLLEIRDLLNK